MWPIDEYYEYITPEQTLSLCDRVPEWTNDEPIPVKR